MPAPLYLILLLSFIASPAVAQEWTFEQRAYEAYQLVLGLQQQEALRKLPEPQTLQEHYVTSLAEILELLINESGEHYAMYEKHFLSLMDRKVNRKDPNALFLKAEVQLQWVFVYLKFGHELDAALNFRQAYFTIQDLRKHFPDHAAAKKTSAMLNIILGSVPEKYNWILGLLNMRGSVNKGLDDLNALRTSDHALAFEAEILYALIQGFVLQETEEALRHTEAQLQQNPGHRALLLLGASLAIKNASSEKALGMLQQLAYTPGPPIPVSDYLLAEVYLHKAQYGDAIYTYQRFLKQYKGQNHIKDAYYKIGLCHWLSTPDETRADEKNLHQTLATSHKLEEVARNFTLARNTGKATTEADKYAARSLASDALPHRALTQVRYFTDGGYYAEARTVLKNILPESLNTKHHQVEYVYRSARLAHKTGKITEAEQYYHKTISESLNDEWYFAPNACLQLGYLARDRNDKSTARLYFNKALSYKKHEYKNSIDTKAKLALAHLNDSK